MERDKKHICHLLFYWFEKNSYRSSPNHLRNLFWVYSVR